MDIFLLLTSCGWCVNQFSFFFFILLFLSFSIFLVVILNFPHFSCVASLGIRVILPLAINNISLGTQ